MSKSIKTPALNNVEYAADNTATALRTFTGVVNGVQYVVEAESVEEAQMLITQQAKATLGDEVSISTDEEAKNNL